MRPLHHMNPIRLSIIRAWIQSHFQHDDTIWPRASRPPASQPLAGLSLLDVGCGGGLVAEAMATLGARVVAIDPCQELIHIAHAHAHARNLEIDYRCCDVQDLLDQQEYFDIILALEVVEHVPDYPHFLQKISSALTCRGIVILSTINRTLYSLALAKVMAEYILGWLPRGSHNWRSFLQPAEVITALSSAGLRVNQIRGLVFDPLLRRWCESSDLNVNYLLAAYAPDFT